MRLELSKIVLKDLEFGMTTSIAQQQEIISQLRPRFLGIDRVNRAVPGCPLTSQRGDIL
jgi:hypothetical protein